MLEQPGRGRAGAARPPRRAVRHRPPRRPEHGRPRDPGDPPGQDPRLRLGVLRRPDGRRADRGAGPDPRRRRGRPASSATATRSSSRTPSTSRSASPARPSTPCSPCRRSGARAAGSIGLVNVVGSAIARECDGGIYLHAGPEVAVASTKALTNMFARLRAARAPARPGARPVDRRRQAADRRAAAAARPDRGDPRPRGRAGRGRRPAGRGREPLLRRPGARLPGRPRGRAEVQGDLLPARRGLPDLRAQARAAGADLARGADRRDRPATTS